MNIQELIVSLNNDKTINESLELLEDIIDMPEALVTKIMSLIGSPERISNTSKFATLLTDLCSEQFIEPLIEIISSSVRGESPWLPDYMYALGSCLDELEEKYTPEESFVCLLGDWMLNSGGGEISWKSSIILANLEHSKCPEYYEQGVLSKELLHLTRVECLKGLVNDFGLSKNEIYQQLLEDEKQEVREAAKSAIDWLNDEERVEA